jgi:hypothetical protein
MKSKTIATIASALVLVTILFNSIPMMAKAPPTTTFYVNPPSITDPSLTPGSSFAVDVKVRNAVDLFGWQVRMTWDAALLEVTDIVNGDILAGQPAGSIGLMVSLSNEDGILMCADSTIGSYPGVNGDGLLCTVTFLVEAFGETVLDIASSEGANRTFYVNSNINDVEVAKENGYFANPIPVHVDIKPGSWPNPINVKSRGTLAVAICGTEDFTVMTVDPARVQLHSKDVERGVYPLRWSWEDVATPYTTDYGGGHALEGDGILDLVFHFDTPEVATVLTLTGNVGETLPLILTGKLLEEYDGALILGQDYVRIR